MMLMMAAGPNILAIIILSLLILLIHRNPILTKERSYSYYILALAMLIVIFFETDVIFIQPVDYLPYLIFYSISFLLVPLIPVFFARVISPSAINMKNKRLLIPFIFHFIISFSNFFTGWYFSISETNTVIRGDLFGMFFIFIFYSYFLLYYASYQAAKKCAKVDRLYFYIPATVALLSTIVQLFFPFLLLGWSGLAIAMFYYYTFMRELQHRYDPLTGVMNRMAFQVMMKKLQKQDQVTIAVFDLNRLKQINDNYGHALGDKVIFDMAIIIQKSFEKIGTVYRIGGDEFCLLIEKSNKDSIEEAFAKIDKGIANHPPIHDIPFSIAYGYAEFSSSSEGTIYDCFDSADSMMYLNKRFIKGVEKRRKNDYKNKTSTPI